MKLSKAKLAFEQLEKELTTIKEEDELRSTLVGGQDITNDCFIKVLDYLDGPTIRLS